MGRAWEWYKREIREILPAFLFFVVAFGLIVVTDGLATAQYGIRPFRLVGAVVLALIVSKVILMTDFLPFVDAFRGRPLIYNTAWKTSIYAITALFFVYAEHLIRFTARYGALAVAQRHVMEQIVWPRFWAIHIWLVVLIAVFVAVGELGRTLGPGRLRLMFFGR